MLWQGVIDREPPTGNCHWLRFYDRDGNLIPLPEEAAQQQAEAAQHRADRLAERLRALGENPDQP
jgi:hypothetical protein